MLRAMFDAFASEVPSIALFGAIYGAISVLIGISKASVGGLFFSIGIIFAGFVLGDWVTGAGGAIALVVFFLTFFGYPSND